MRKVIVFIAATLLASFAYAADSQDVDASKVLDKPVVADTPEAFAQQAAWIEQEMQADGRYEFTNPSERQRVRGLLSQMASLLQRSGSVAAMDQNTKLKLFNTQEEVNAILKHNDSNRLVCESRKPIGSNIPQTHCHTYRQMEETARNTKAGMQQFDHSRLCNGGGEAGCAPGSRSGH